MSRDKERLQDILEAIDRIEKYAAKGRDEFDRDELIQTWVVHHLQIIGEAARVLSEELRTSAADVPWAQIIAMRNILVHDYLGIDLDEVWSATVRDLPGLKQSITRLLQRLTDS